MKKCQFRIALLFYLADSDRFHVAPVTEQEKWRIFMSHFRENPKIATRTIMNRIVNPESFLLLDKMPEKTLILKNFV